MSNTKLTIIARFLVKPEKLELVLSEIPKMIKATREEEGCIDYDLHQDNENPNLFLFYENWTTRELWQKHMNSDHVNAYRAATQGAIEEFTLNEMSILFE